MLLMCFSVAPSVMFSSVGDPDVRPALGHRREDLALARREARQRVVGAVADHELGDDLRVERRAAAGDPPQGVHELADVADAVLQQVADAAGPVGEELRRVLPLDVLAQDEDRRGRARGGGPRSPPGGPRRAGSAASGRRRPTRPAGAPRRPRRTRRRRRPWRRPSRRTPRSSGRCPRGSAPSPRR